MSRSVQKAAVLVGCAGYLVVFGWSINSLTYDEWGVLVVTPPIVLLVVVMLRSMFTGDLAPIAKIMYAGIAAKLLGAALRYWVGFEAYQGGIDAQRYHNYAVTASRDIWDGASSITTIFRGGTGTPIMEGATNLVYLITGTSKMAGFVTFAMLGFVGTAFFVKAACIAIPGLAARRYAVLCIVVPSLVYWPSSIGKDAVMLFTLGVATYGIARLVSTTAILIPLAITTAGLIGAGYIRPHLVGLWLAGAFPALLVSLIRGRDLTGSTRRGIERALLLPILVVATIGLLLVSLATVRYLNPKSDDALTEATITNILDETKRRTEQANSSFQPPSISNPVMWPYASVRTITRPLLFEARGSAQLFTALELTAFLAILASSYRRLLHLPKLLVTNAYVAFAMTTLFLSGLAFTSFANLGILARQRSIVFPFMLLVLCLPALSRRTAHDPEGAVEVDAALARLQTSSQKSSISPRVSAQLASGGSPALFTARHVSTGPPPGNGTNDDDIWA